MYTRPVKHIMGAIAMFAAFAAWGRDISIESVNGAVVANYTG